MDQHEYSKLVDFLAEIPDPRCARGQRHSWGIILTLLAAGLVSGQPHVSAIGQWVHERQAELCQWLRPERGHLPSTATLRRAAQRLSVEVLEERVAAFVASLRPVSLPRAPARPTPPPPRGLALDGKAVRGANRHGAGLHLVSMVEHTTGQVYQQRAIPVGGCEQQTVQALLASQVLTNTVITLDALHTQPTVAQTIRQRGGDYLLVVKGNQPDLYAALALVFAPAFPAEPDDAMATATTWAKGHGRLERRTLTRSLALNAYLAEWPDVGQVLRRVTTRRDLSTGQVTVSVTYGLTSLPVTIGPRRVERYWRGHWTIENRVHYVRDVTWREDAGQTWVGHTAQVLAALRNALSSLLRRRGWANIAAALRHYGAYANRALTLLGAHPG